MKYNIKGYEYNYITNVRENDQARTSFNQLAKETFGISFESWYQKGYWGDNYIPYALMDGDTVISNVSVNIIDTTWKNQKKRYVQLGTVMTAATYRHKGLSNWLMEKVLTEWNDKCDAIFLYANDSVLDFYPKFGFEKAIEYQYTMKVQHKETTVEKLDMSSEKDIQLLLRTYELSNPFSALPMENNSGLLMFYCSQFMRENIYYVEQYESIVVAEHDGNNLICYDVFSEGNCQLGDILNAVATENTKAAILGFTPKHTENCIIEELHAEDTTLFLLKSKENLFVGNKLMIPLLAHA